MTLDARTARSLLAFWAEAGVEAMYADAPQDRTNRDTAAPARPRPAKSPVLATPEPVFAGQASRAPADSLDVARATAAAAETLSALAIAIEAFEGCALKGAGARRSVFSRGAPDSPVMLIGEAPGEEEDLKGEPFVGRSGQLLDRILGAAGLSGRVFITNTVFWRPPGNRTPTRSEQAVCQPFLERAIELVEPRMILVVGGAAATAVLGKNVGILGLRGRWLEWQATYSARQLPCLPTLHPSFLLRQPAAKKLVWRDVLTLAERLDRLGRPS